jgi:hypothetical protein
MNRLRSRLAGPGLVAGPVAMQLPAHLVSVIRNG